jgi:heme oxygenase|tara:strand:- start:3614 stop:4231 length:618 start_codon:yes stop_codon:yes gene_type:complete
MSNNLKELTRAHHDNAERTEFADMLLGGGISPRLYQEYLHAQLSNYRVLEGAVAVPMELEPIFRSAGIEEDLQEIEALYDLEEIEEDLTSTKEYAKHISTLVEKKDNDGLLAHLYVRHFGDAHGGQIIKRNVPGAGLMYEFEDRKDLIALTRTLLHDGMETEAKNCFEYAERLFHELIERFHNNAGDYEPEDYALARKMGSFEEE